MEAFHTDAVKQGIILTGTPTLTQGESASAVVAALVKQRTKIVIPQCGAFVLRKLFCEALHQGLVADDVAWFIPGWFSKTWATPSATESHNCTGSDIRRASHGAIEISYGLGAETIAKGTHTITPTGKTPAAMTAGYEDRIRALGPQHAMHTLGFRAYSAGKVTVPKLLKAGCTRGREPRGSLKHTT